MLRLRKAKLNVALSPGKMKALIFIPTLTVGGAERVASILANRWCEYPETSVTLLLMFDDEICFPVDPRVKIRSLGQTPNLGAVARLLSVARASLLFRQVVKEEAPDFVLSFMNKYNVFCLASLLGTGIRTIVSERDSPTEGKRELNWRFRQVLYPLASGVITQTEEGKRHLIKRIGDLNVAVIYNPVGISKTNEFSLNRENVVLNVGRLVAKKGQADLLRAFAKAGNPDWNLVICGDGPLRKDLEALARHLGLNDRVRFMGTVKDVNICYARAGVFAFPSYCEGFPNALAEAMVAGAPTVSYDCPTGPAELIDHGQNGYLVEVGDIEGMARHLRELMTDTAQREQFSRNAARVADKLDAAKIAKRYFEFCAASAAQHKRLHRPCSRL